MGFEESVKRMLEVGPNGLLSRPDLMYDMFVGMAAKLGENAGLQSRLNSLEDITTTQNEQINNAKRAINLLYKQMGGREAEALGAVAAPSMGGPSMVSYASQGMPHDSPSASTLASPTGAAIGHRDMYGRPQLSVATAVVDAQPSSQAVAAQAAAVSGMGERVDRLERLQDIMSERMSINQSLLEKIQTLDEVVIGKEAERQGQMAKLESVAISTDQNAAAVFQMEQRVDSVIDNVYNLTQKLDALPMSVKQPVDEQVDPLRKELKHVEKKLVTALANIANKVSESSYEIDRLRAEEEGVLHTRLKEVEHSLAAAQRGLDAKADLSEIHRAVEGTVLRHGTTEDTDHLYQLLDLNKRDVAWAVQSGATEDKMQVLHALPCFAGLTLAVSRLTTQQPIVHRPVSPTGDNRGHVTVLQAAAAATAAVPATPAGLNATPASVGGAPGGKQLPVVGLEIVDGPGPGTGVRVVSVVPGSPATAAGFQTGDRILAFNASPTDTRTTFMEAAMRCQPGSRVMLVRVTPLAPSFPENVELTLGVRTVAVADRQDSVSPSGVQKLRMNAQNPPAAGDEAHTPSSVALLQSVRSTQPSGSPHW